MLINLIRLISIILFSILKAAIKNNGIFVYFSPGLRRGWGNFGDLITPYILEKEGFTPIWCPPRYASICGAGSIITKINKNKKILILGSGQIERNNSISTPNVYAVRGARTRDDLKIKCQVLGDPGMILPQYYKPNHIENHKKIEKTLMIPHYTEFPLVKKTYSGRADILDVTRPLEHVVDQIVSHTIVMSSSLHGVIVSLAYGTPVIWVKFNKDLKGGSYKFIDFFSGFLDEKDIPKQITIDDAIDISHQNLREMIIFPNDKFESNRKLLFELHKKVIVGLKQ